MELIIITIALFILGIFVLIKSSIFTIKYLAQIARFLGMSEFSVSFILMAFATTLPDFAIGINSALYGTPEIALGNMLGANIVTLSLILGIVATISGRVTLEDHGVFTSHRLFDIALIISPVILLLDGILSRIDGFILLLLFLLNFLILFKLRERIKNKSLFNHLGNSLSSILKSIHTTLKSLALFMIATVFLLGGSYIVVYSASNLSMELGMPEILIGIFVIGLGTSLPELTFGVRSAVSGKGSMSLGNLFGAAVLNSTLILGVVSLINPIVITVPKVFWIGSIFMVIIIFTAFYFLKSKDFLARKEGIFLLFIYIIFLVLQIGVGAV